MLLVINAVVMVLLSLVPTHKEAGPDPYGLRQIVGNPSARAALLGGNFAEYHAQVSRALAERLAIHSGKDRSAVGQALADETRAGRQNLLASIELALSLATMVTELQLLGPARAMGQAIDWVESGLIRQSGLKADRFPSFYRIIASPNRPRISANDERALAGDLSRANGEMDSAFARLMGELRESGI